MAGPIRRYLEAALEAAELERKGGGWRAGLAPLGISVEAGSAKKALARLSDAIEAEVLRRLVEGRPLPVFGGESLGPAPAGEGPRQAIARIQAELDRLAAWVEGSARPSRSEGKKPDLAAWLSERGFRLVRAFEEESPEEARVLNRLALFMGARYRVLEKCLKKLKRALSTGKPLVHSLQKADPEEIQSVTQLCTLFKEYAFASDYTYRGRVVRAEPSREPRFINFANGGWLERYLQLLLERRLKGPKTVWRGVQVVLPTGEQGELDLLLAYRGKVFWIEAKTAAYQSGIRRYARVRELLGLPPERSFLVSLEAPPERKKSLSELYRLTVLSPEELLPRLEQA